MWCGVVMLLLLLQHCCIWSMTVINYQPREKSSAFAPTLSLSLFFAIHPPKRMNRTVAIVSKSNVIGKLLITAYDFFFDPKLFGNNVIQHRLLVFHIYFLFCLFSIAIYYLRFFTAFLFNFSGCSMFARPHKIHSP